jgi:hypothetical protein
MADLLLHIGHVKTGSTWLQEAFRTNAGRLDAAGIRYPLPRDVDRDARVPAGNALGVFDDPARTAARLARATRPAGRTTLLSSETIFDRLAARDRLDFLPAAAHRAGFDRVRLLLFVRAPLPLAASIWQQRVKGHRGERRELDSFAARSFAMPQRVIDTVSRLRDLDGVEVTLRNYDSHRGDLLAVVETWLGLPAGALVRPGRERLNRSLTRAEAALQLALNRAIGASGEIFAVRLGNRLDDVPPDPPRISPAVAEALLARHADALDRIDALLPPGEALSRDVPDAAEGPLVFTEAQLETIAEGVAAWVRPAPRDRLLRAARALRRFVPL